MALYIDEEKQFNKDIFTLDEIKAIITPIAEKYKLKAVYIFGSYARGEATPDSDIDILIDREGSIVKGWVIGGLYNDLQESLNKEIDLLETDTLEHYNETEDEQLFNNIVKSERIKIYDR